MPKKETPANGERSPLIIPKFDQYFLGRDPMDPNSREQFQPWNFEFTKTGNGGMKLSTREAGFDPEESANGMEIIFLFETRQTQCRAENKKLKERRFCYSPDREYAHQGYFCKECPYADKQNVPQNVDITRPLYKTLFFLARRPNRDEEFKLIRYTTKLNNIDPFIALKSSAKGKMKKDFELDTPMAAAATVIIYHKLEKPVPTDQSVVVGRFDSSRFTIGTRLNDAEINEVKNLITALVQYVDENVDRQNKRNRERYEDNRVKGLLNPWAHPAKTHAQVQTQAPTGAPSGDAHDSDIPPADGEGDFDPATMTDGLTAPAETVPPVPEE